MEVYDFGLRLKELRKQRKLSQRDVAKRLNVTRGAVSRYECNTNMPSTDILIDLAVLYNTSLDYMMGLDHRPCFYLDDLTESQQQTVLDMVIRLKQEFLKEKFLKEHE